MNNILFKNDYRLLAKIEGDKMVAAMSGYTLDEFDRDTTKPDPHYPDCDGEGGWRDSKTKKTVVCNCWSEVQ